MMPHVKVCGITSLTDARYCSGAGAAYLGFIFCDSSPRFISVDLASRIRTWIHGVQCVGVFVDEDTSQVNETVRRVRLDYVQLHGSETPAYCKSIEAPVIKALRIREQAPQEDVLAAADTYAGVADHILLDTSHPQLPGGTGTVFDWKLAQSVARTYPIFLAGGLTPANVQEAIDYVQPYAIDLASGLEAAPGQKDFALVDTLFRQVNKN